MLIDMSDQESNKQPLNPACPIARCVALLGYSGVARICGVDQRAVRRWVSNGRLPRTEATGETNYAGALARNQKAVSKRDLRATVYLPR